MGATRGGRTAGLARRGRRRPPFLAVLLLVGAVLAGCGSVTPQIPSGEASPGPGAIQIVTTTTFLADFVRQIGGSHVSVISLVPKGGDVHTFDPRPSSAFALSRARLIVMNGLGLDDWLGQLAGDVGTGSVPIVRAAEHLPGVAYISSDGVTNPHVWLDVSLAKLEVDSIAAAMEQVDPANATAYRANATSYGEHLTSLAVWAAGQIGAIPPANRRIVAFHDALPYFTRAYGLQVVGVVVSAPGQEPSAQEVTRLIDAIRAAQVRAVFSEAQFSPELARTVANETGVSIVSDLYTDTLGDRPVDTYEGLIRWDVQRFVEALR